MELDDSDNCDDRDDCDDSDDRDDRDDRDDSDYSGDVCTACSKRGPCCWSSTQGEWKEHHLVCNEHCESVLFKQLHRAKLDGGRGGKKRLEQVRSKLKIER